MGEHFAEIKAGSGVDRQWESTGMPPKDWSEEELADFVVSEAGKSLLEAFPEKRVVFVTGCSPSQLGMEAHRLRSSSLDGVARSRKAKQWKDPSVPNCINSLIFSVLSLFLGLKSHRLKPQFRGRLRVGLAQQSRVHGASERESPRTSSLPQTTVRLPQDWPSIPDEADEPAESAAPAQKAAPRARQQAVQGPAPAGPANAVQGDPGVVVEQVSTMR